MIDLVDVLRRHLWKLNGFSISHLTFNDNHQHITDEINLMSNIELLEKLSEALNSAGLRMMDINNDN